MKDDSAYLRHIFECAAAIQGYVVEGRAAFDQDRRTQKAILRELQELSESLQHISQETKVKHPEIPWRDIAAFRNVLVHDYLGINLDRIWETIHEDLPSLVEKIKVLDL
ncbi:MAG TPA: HepT-like ribonuclease domain-containing protein [bacterium]|jgi:uncharacterized protein with HEPN domain|nr:HepT-like ribonuclease domain-containing protein [bacterium]